MGNVNAPTPDLTGAVAGPDGRYLKYLDGKTPMKVYVLCAWKQGKISLVEALYTTREVATAHCNAFAHLPAYKGKGITHTVEEVDGIESIADVRTFVTAKNGNKKHVEILQLTIDKEHVFVTISPFIF